MAVPATEVPPLFQSIGWQCLRDDLAMRRAKIMEAIAPLWSKVWDRQVSQIHCCVLFYATFCHRFCQAETTACTDARTDFILKEWLIWALYAKAG